MCFPPDRDWCKTSKSKLCKLGNKQNIQQFRNTIQKPLTKSATPVQTGPSMGSCTWMMKKKSNLALAQFVWFAPPPKKKKEAEPVP